MGDQAISERGLAGALDAERRLQPGGNLRRSWEELLAEARRCTRCELYKCGTQTVFGEGPLSAKILFLGEQPGEPRRAIGGSGIGPAAKQIVIAAG